MHEMSTCKSLLRQIENIANTQSKKNVVKVILSIGELARVDTNELVELFPIAAKNTCAQNASIVIEHVPVTIKCNHCGETTEVTPGNLDCPLCNGDNTQLVAGTDMLLKELEFA